MSFKPPTDFTKPLLALVIGTTVGLTAFALTGHRLPHVGDNIHSLPHGGQYRDGNKHIFYGAPSRKPDHCHNDKFWAISAVAILLVLILISERFGRRRGVPCVH